MYERPKSKEIQLTLNTGGTVTGFFVLPRASRIKRYYAAPLSADQAAHASIADTVTFTNKGPAWAAGSVVAILTNESDQANAVTRKSAAWTRGVAMILDTEARPVSAEATNVADEIAAGSIIQVDLLGAGTTPTANIFIIGIEYVDSD